jgi:hypothetical protein
LLEYIRIGHKIVSRDRSIRLPRVPDDETPQSTDDRPVGLGMRPRAWMRWLASKTRRAEPEPQAEPTRADGLDVHATLRALPTLLDGSTLPNGVVELLIEDFEAPTRQLFDIHDGRVTLVEPGKCVPWACIAGPPTAWAKALGAARDTAGLRLTGDKQLAQRVLVAFPRRD